MRVRCAVCKRAAARVNTRVKQAADAADAISARGRACRIGGCAFPDHVHGRNDVVHRCAVRNLGRAIKVGAVVRIRRTALQRGYRGERAAQTRTALDVIRKRSRRRIPVERDLRVARRSRQVRGRGGNGCGARCCSGSEKFAAEAAGIGAFAAVVDDELEGVGSSHEARADGEAAERLEAAADVCGDCPAVEDDRRHRVVGGSAAADLHTCRVTADRERGLVRVVAGRVRASGLIGCGRDPFGRIGVEHPCAACNGELLQGHIRCAATPAGGTDKDIVRIRCAVRSRAAARVNARAE